jgi:hypothetical protein
MNSAIIINDDLQVSIQLTILIALNLSSKYRKHEKEYLDSRICIDSISCM